jgi:hypothetical protein
MIEERVVRRYPNPNNPEAQAGFRVVGAGMDRLTIWLIVGLVYHASIRCQGMLRSQIELSAQEFAEPKP